MSAKNILNLGLFVLVLLLATVIYFTEEADTELEKLTAVDINKINTKSILEKQNI